MNNSQSGNIFAVLFGAVALVGVLAAAGMQLITGPLRTMTAITQKNLVEGQIYTNARLVVINAGIQANNGDADSDSFIEPTEYVPNGTGDCNITLVGGGCLPLTLGASLTDPFGSAYGYCVWDHGAVDNGHADGAAAAPYRLNGDTDPTQPVIALISAGRDKIFQTSCRAYDGAGTDGVNRVVGSDDMVFTYTYAEASAASGGLWAIKPTDADTAEIAKDLEVKDSSNNVTVAIDRATGIGDFLGITTDIIAAKTGGDITVEGLTEIEIPTDDGDILTLRNQDAPMFVFNSAYNSNHRLPIFEMLGTNDIGGTRGVAGIIEGNTTSTQWQASDAILQFNAKRGGGASTVGNLFNWMSNDSPVMTLSHEGNLGIGSGATTPIAPLQLQNRLYQYTHSVNLGHARGSYVEFFRAFGLSRAVNLIIQVTENNIKHTSMTFLVNMNYDDYSSPSIVRILPISGSSRRNINTTGYGSGEIALEYTGGASGIFRLRSVGETDQTGSSPFVISIFSVGAGGEILSTAGSDTSNFSYPIYRNSLITQQMGSVGINSSNPLYRLDLNTDTNSKIRALELRLSADTGNNTARIYGEAFGNRTLTYHAGTHRFVTGSSQTERLRVASDGKIGIGSATPQATLDVAGGIRVGNDLGDCDGARQGSTRFDNTNLCFSICDGTSWQCLMGGGSIELEDTANACTSSNEGAIKYDSVNKCLSLCDGVAWDCQVSGIGCDNTPADFSFAPLSSQGLNAIVQSEIVLIAGTDPGCLSTVSVNGTGSPEYRVCSTNNCSSVDQDWTNMNMSFDIQGKYVQVRTTTPSTDGSTHAVNVTVGNRVTTWTVSTASSGACGANPSIGQICSDGSVYAGTTPAGNKNLYVARCDVGMSFDGSNCTGLTEDFSWSFYDVNVDPTYDRFIVGAGDMNNGKLNTNLLLSADSHTTEPGIQPFPAAVACGSLSAHGHSDWFLPARYEWQNVIYPNLIDGTPADSSPDPVIPGNSFAFTNYYSSTEASTDRAFYLNMSNGTVTSSSGVRKNIGLRVRCARTD